MNRSVLPEVCADLAPESDESVPSCKAKHDHHVWGERFIGSVAFPTKAMTLHRTRSVSP